MSKIMTVPRGKAGLPNMVLDMARIYQAEERLKEIAYVSPVTSRELGSFFNEVTNETTKYLAWVEYEILRAEKERDIAKAKVILEKAPLEAEKLKDLGMKANTEWREALVSMDKDYQDCSDRYNALIAVKYLLEAKAKTFERAYFSAKLVGDERGMVTATPNINGFNGQLDNAIIGGYNGK